MCVCVLVCVGVVGVGVEVFVEVWGWLVNELHRRIRPITRVSLGENNRRAPVAYGFNRGIPVSDTYV